MTFATTAIYAAVLGIILIVLRTLVTLRRAKSGISILHSNDMALAEAMRRHGNFVETVPHALILMGLAESMGASGLAMHAIGGMLLASRLIHPFGLNHERAAHPLRIVSGLLTTVSLLISIVLILKPVAGL